jgi:hypothetical protein
MSEELSSHHFLQAVCTVVLYLNLCAFALVELARVYLYVNQ